MDKNDVVYEEPKKNIIKKMFNLGTSDVKIDARGIKPKEVKQDGLQPRHEETRGLPKPMPQRPRQQVQASNQPLPEPEEVGFGEDFDLPPEPPQEEIVESPKQKIQQQKQSDDNVLEFVDIKAGKIIKTDFYEVRQINGVLCAVTVGEHGNKIVRFLD